MSNKLFSKDPFGVFPTTTSPSGFDNLPEYDYRRKKTKSSLGWQILMFFLLMIGFGLLIYFKDSLIQGFKKMVSKANDKINPEQTQEATKTEVKLLSEFIDPKVECILLVKDKADWDIQYINKKKEERKAIYTEEMGWTIYE
jgi:hypothetical protein